MPIKVDSYHLIQFVLQAANNVNEDWVSFVNHLEKVYKGNVPDKVLHALLRKDIPDLTALCNKLLDKNDARKTNLQAVSDAKEVKIQQWMERRNKGNHAAWVRFYEHKKATAEQQKQDQALMWDNYVDKMKPIWEAETMKLIDKRLNEIRQYFPHSLDK
jgi:hypothetical protein